MEQWQEIKGYEGLYEVSDLGRIKRTVCIRKLSLEDVNKARLLRHSGLIYSEIAAQFGVTQRAIIKALNHPAKRQAHRVPNRILKPLADSHGYIGVCLCKNGKVKFIQVHILVARAFLGLPPEGTEVNHKNGIKADPRLDNLEYITHQQNMLHASRVLKRKFGGNHRKPS